ncbi:MAG TPA: septal ring lytic transglycosylase RlpA family protein [Candidatus Binataceae bacterium]|nr:septal ring lytic transglycosylase RlpA family protein [Candidatus Binataceae bacterium]
MTLVMAGAALFEFIGCATAPVEVAPPPPPPVVAQPAHPPPRTARRKVEIASWYGPGFNGHITSTGERFNQNAMTAASKTLPLGSRVVVRNPANGKSVVVRINDRGPHVRGRTMDLSKRAAQKLGITGKGVAHVEVTPLHPRPDDDAIPFPSTPSLPSSSTPSVAESHI